MVPIYQICSWLALLVPAQAIYFNTFRGCYEAYVIYSFYMYLVTFLGDLHGEDQIIDLLERKPELEFEHMFPFSFLPKIRMGEPFLHMCRRGIIAYVCLRLFTAMIALPLEIWGAYGDGRIDFNKAYFWISMVNNVGKYIFIHIYVVLYYIILYYIIYICNGVHI